MKRRRRQKQRKHRAGRVLLLLLVLVLATGTGMTGYAAWRVDQAMDQFAQKDSLPELANQPITVLIMGRDHRPETGTNLTDVMIVAGINPQSGQVSMVSIPRDTKVKLPIMNKRVKANEAYNYGEHLRLQAERNQQTPETDGPTLAKEMAASLFEIPIDHFVLVDFTSFTSIVDEVGGITVDVEKDMLYHDPTDDTNINLKAGVQHLNGKEALDWVRHRQDDRGHAFYSSDFDRNKRQQEAIKAIAQELTTWKGLMRIFNVMDTMAQHVETDLSKEQLKELIWAFKTFDTQNLKSIETPNVYWDSRRLQTVIPEEDLTVAHRELEKIRLRGKTS
ncbi:LCP family protein [Ammoniphilus sp. YIM 78166]|uniref:LCP family protein n=1 Tax=Ammoniphilus sp. YIM 78166 TaxID=1644106 RepID=UPI0014309BA9|nr:LCP family protein [Ammoniphilus sp. YIM 78166]